MGYWITDRKTGTLYYQVTRRVRVPWNDFNKETLERLLKHKQIFNLDYLEALLDIEE